MRFLVGVVLVVSMGCIDVQLIRHPYAAADPNAPVDETGSGEIRYRLVPATLEESRAEAYRQMKSACQGPYKITFENADAPPDPWGPRNQAQTWRVIRFRCVVEKAATPIQAFE